CHGIETKSVGPAYKTVAQKYKNDPKALDYLANKVIKGGGGVWGENVMSAHPTLTLDQTKEMVKYILSLDGGPKGTVLPAQGSYVTRIPADAGSKGAFVIRAAYTDKGANTIAPLTSEQVVVLRNPTVLAMTADKTDQIFKYKIPGTTMEAAVALSKGAYVAFDNIDLTGITQLTFAAIATREQTKGGRIQVRLDSPTGKMIGESAEIVPIEKPVPQEVKATLDQTSGTHTLYLVFTSDTAKANEPLLALMTLHFQNGGKGAVADKAEPKRSISMR
ncbi:MAG: carbohydrate-binding protein, partial [Ferruginibacter sp.]|nr:carbohydrate-binding protein [Cytophagales bacterium]